MINLSVQPSELINIKDCTTAKGAWDSLCGLYKANTACRKVKLFKKLVRFEIFSGQIIPSKIVEFRGIIDDLKSIGIELLCCCSALYQKRWKTLLLLLKAETMVTRMVTMTRCFWGMKNTNTTNAVAATSSIEETTARKLREMANAVTSNATNVDSTATFKLSAKRIMMKRLHRRLMQSTNIWITTHGFWIAVFHRICADSENALQHLSRRNKEFCWRMVRKCMQRGRERSL